MTSPRRTLSDFEGTWQIARDITHADGLKAALSGTATFTRARGGLDYAEVGALTLGSAPPFEATQRYHWDENLDVTFPDGRFFHRVPVAGGSVTHWCDPDRYDGTYDFSDWPRWTIEWQVHGPRKDYTSVTRLWR